MSSDVPQWRTVRDQIVTSQDLQRRTTDQSGSLPRDRTPSLRRIELGRSRGAVAAQERCRVPRPPKPLAVSHCDCNDSLSSVTTPAKTDSEPIDLDDGSWVDVGSDGRWRPTIAERVRAAVILSVTIVALLLVGLTVSLSDGTRQEDEAVATSTADSTTTEPSTTVPSELDPSSLGGEPAPIQCVSDDREGKPLADRRLVIALVLNGTSQDGHAGGVARRLQARGYVTTEPGDTDRRETTSAAYLAGHCAEAVRLLEDVGMSDFATVQPLPNDMLPRVGRARVVLSLGADSL